MKRFAMALGSGLIGLAAAAFAQDATVPTVEDTDGNGTYSLQELQVTFPDITDQVYAEIDTNADGSVDQMELAAAITDGKLQTSG